MTGPADMCRTAAAAAAPKKAERHPPPNALSRQVPPTDQKLTVPKQSSCMPVAAAKACSHDRGNIPQQKSLQKRFNARLKMQAAGKSPLRLLRVEGGEPPSPERYDPLAPTLRARSFRPLRCRSHGARGATEPRSVRDTARARRRRWWAALHPRATPRPARREGTSSPANLSSRGPRRPSKGSPSAAGRG